MIKEKKVDYLKVSGARQHNLQNVNLQLPKGNIILITGVSGSGKSSLAFDTIYAEGQRRYLESLSSYARQFLETMEKPDVDGIEGLSPAIAIEQKTTSNNPRSTVGTVTEIYDYLRLLFARVGVPYSPATQLPMTSLTVGQMVEKVQNLRGRVYLLAPIARSKKGEFLKEVQELRAQGYKRLYIDGAWKEIQDFKGLERHKKHDVFVVVDRLKMEGASKGQERIGQAIEAALSLSHDLVYVMWEEESGESGSLWLSSACACPISGFTLGKIEPQLFSFNNPWGACPQCQGTGAIFADLDHPRGQDADHKIQEVCPACQGSRLKPEALCVKVNGLHIQEVCQMSIERCFHWFHQDFSKNLSQGQRKIAEPILREIKQRLKFLYDVGLTYLSLSRTSGTLSGGENQRIRLASQVGSGLTGVLYVLDEPSIGLHQRDNDRLLQTLKRLKSLGNTVIVVEHDEEAIKASDYIVDMGPLAGRFGGQVMACGTYQEILAHPKSLTGAYLRGEKHVPDPKKRGKSDEALTLFGASLNNLKGVNLEVPVGRFVGVTGVSGSGKSSLIMETLFPVLSRIFQGRQVKDEEDLSYLPYQVQKVTGLQFLDKVISIDQSPIGRTPRSNPGTYAGAFTPIREWFARLPKAQSMGFSPGRFSFNVKGGRCEACCGEGEVKIAMHFLPDIFVPCDACEGKRYRESTLAVTYKGLNIQEVLSLPIEEAADFFRDVPSVFHKLSALVEVGLGYLQVGQKATTLSGGEAQRVKLAKELSRRSTGKTLYILDEPTTGLHFHDIAKLITILQSLVDSGNTVLVIEHNLEVIRSADWVIDIGPEGGEGGGRIIAQGPPESIKSNPQSWTGKYL